MSAPAPYMILMRVCALLLCFAALVPLGTASCAEPIGIDGAATNPSPAQTSQAQPTIRVGVLAHMGEDTCRKMWQPTMDYLEKAMEGYRFELAPLSFNEVEPAVASQSVDFLICNPAMYVQMEVKHGATRIMTLRKRVSGRIVSEFGSVVLCRSDRTDLKGLGDARGQRLAATGRNSFGGWYMALREFRVAGIEPEKDCAKLSFLENHTAVVRAVLSGEADLGVVRSGTIERMALEREIALEQIRVVPNAIAPGPGTSFPFLLSTRLYPEWPFAKLSHTTNEIARDLTVALLTMPADSPAALAAESGGWDVCLAYTSVHECLRELHAPPYEHYGEVSRLEMIRQHWPWMTAIGVLILALLGALLLLRGRQLQMARVAAQNRLLLASAGEGICGIDPDGLVTFVNPAAARILGFEVEDLLGKDFHALTHHTKPDGNPYPSDECPIYLARKDGTVHRGSDECFIRKDGSVIPISYSSQPVIDNGKNCGIVVCFRDITEQKRADAELRASESRFRSHFELPLFGIAITSPEKGWLQANRRICSLLGYTRDEIVHMTWSEMTHPEDLAEDTAQFQRMLSGQIEHYQMEKRFVRKDGAVVWTNLAVGCVRKPDGQVDHVVALLDDISERKRNEDSLRQLSKAVEQCPASIVITNYAGVIEYVNPKFLEVSGYSREDILGHNPRILKSGDKSPDVYKDLWKMITAGKEWRGEFHNRKKNGELYWESASISAIRNASGSITHFLAVKEDITERKQAEDALRASEARMRAITDSAQDAILMMDPDGLISYWNPAAERILGYTLAEAIGRDLHHFIVPPRYCDAHGTAFPAFRLSGEGAAVGKTLDLEAVRKDGAEISVQLSLSSIQIDGGWHAVGVMRDITERKRAEVELKTLNRHLEQATARANEMATQAEMASAAKSEFLANMSHEIRTPMNGVIGMTGLLLDTELDDEQRRYAEIVRNSGESLLALLNDILDFSKMEAGKLEMETLDFDLRVMLDDFAALLALRAHEKGLEFICAVAPDVPAYLRGDPGRLRQILTNLAGNAVKFTHQGEVAVRASVVSETEKDAVLRFSIKDTGIGVPVDKKNLLFQKFTQADASTTRHYGGTGLGLAISKQLAEKMGGGIGVVSEMGQGSEFWFTVQLEKQAMREHDAALATDILGAHILIVDDNATNREVLMIQFAAWGVRAEETPDGPTALCALNRALDAGDPFRVAVIDMQMPGMDGETLGRAIQADARLRDTRMVMLTSLGMRGDAKRYEEIGFAAYATKPIRHQELKSVLEIALAERSGATSATRAITTRYTAREAMGQFIGRKARILLAEDNITNQQVALGILKQLGLRADAVANGVEAVKALETLPYDVALMDVQMPEMDGFEATRIIRNPESKVQNHDIPIIAMTAHALQGDRERCLAAGMNGYISKPVSPQALAEALNRWLPKVDSTKIRNSETRLRPAKASGSVSKALTFDRAAMMSRLLDDEELARAVVNGFLTDIPLQIAALKTYLENEDAEGAERQAHTIKGASSNVGGEALCVVASAMEKAGKLCDFGAIQSRMSELELEFGRLNAAMTREVLTQTDELDALGASNKGEVNVYD